jgi:hypothetical protein
VDQPTEVEQWTAGIPFSRLVASAIQIHNLEDIDHIDEVGDLLKGFMPEKEVSDIYLNFSNKK